MASERYNAPVREKHWQKVWNDHGAFPTNDKSKKPKRYQLGTCSPTRPGASTWGTCATTRWAT